MVGMVAPPHACAGCRVEPEVLPGPPQALEAGDRLRVAPPVCSPPVAGVSGPDGARVDVAEVLPHELINGAVDPTKPGSPKSEGKR